MRYLIFAILFLTCFIDPLSAQEKAVQDSIPFEKVVVQQADELKGLKKGDKNVKKLIGNVVLRQKDIFMSCDSAITDEVDVNASGNVVIQQGDTTNLFGDSLAYLGETRIAELFDSVVMVNGKQQLFTDRLRYDMYRRVGSYFTGAVLDNGRTQLSSVRGYYYVATDEAYFKDSVIIIDEQFELHADTLKFNTKTEVATFLGPTRIIQDSSRIYCESGFYDIKNQVALFETNAQYMKGQRRASGKKMFYDGQKKEITIEGKAYIIDENRKATAERIRYNELSDISYLEGDARFVQDGQVVTGDTIVYFGESDTYKTKGRSVLYDSTQILMAYELDFNAATGIGTAEGDVYWQDTVENLSILCDKAFYEKKSDYLLATGFRPLFITNIEGDSLYMTADTLLANRMPGKEGDSSRVLQAYQDVRVFKSNLQAVGDSLSYSTGDSIFQLYYDPIIWSDTSQFSADTIYLQMANNQIHRIYLNKRAMILNSPDEIYFNQIRGRKITAFFEENEIFRADVFGNAQTVYYILDDQQAYVGPNAVECSTMKIFLENNQVTDIRFYELPTGVIYPMLMVDHESIKLEDYKWEIRRRPMEVEDLFLPKDEFLKD